MGGNSNEIPPVFGRMISIISDLSANISAELEGHFPPKTIDFVGIDRDFSKEESDLSRKIKRKRHKFQTKAIYGMKS
ncbi:hypothetical protein LEP1GSC061_2042 [Leptospira wolffii serovar Khorat str. Khorat-H2]|nr:hypothetical protein LEP1GSC061_2042 [Leptospira wolffii serovar Khorat str. Khorat-H2]